MPQSLSLDPASQASNKRQRSRESRNTSSRSASQQARRGSLTLEAEKLAQSGMRLPSYLSKAKSEIQSAFQDIEWKQRYRLVGAINNVNSPWHVDRSPTIGLRNRYNGIQPWANARVKLKTPIDGSDYINASPIKLRPSPPAEHRRGRSNSILSDSVADNLHETRYVATQGPKSGQYTHFWHMVMQETTGDVGVIVMLTPCYEGTKEKCAPYFPQNMADDTLLLPSEPQQGLGNEDGDPFLDFSSNSSGTDSSGTDNDNEGTIPNSNESDSNVEQGIHHSVPRPSPAKLQSGPGYVQLVSVRNDEDIGCEVRELNLVIGSQSKTIYHYLFESWPDFGKPEAQDRIALLQLMKTSRKIAGDSPRIVHCSAGVGRTGTWIALDHLLKELDEGRLVGPPSVQQVDVEGGNGAATAEIEGAGVTQMPNQPTWGKSGPAKATTPPAVKEADVIHDTVDNLRIQRMMMVMNQLQYGFIYEVLREAFIAKYAEREIGAVITQAAEENAAMSMSEGGEERSPKVARTSSHADQPEHEVDVERDGGGSEAETELGDEHEEEISAEVERQEKADMDLTKGRMET